MYTIAFLLFSLLIALLSFIPDPNVGNVILFLATVVSITFIFLMFESLIPQLDKYFFSPEKKFDLRKLILFLVNFFISFIIVLIYFLNATSTQIQIQFLGWDVLLPGLFIIVYFGWNIIQIFFLKRGFEDISDKVNDKISIKYGISKKKEIIHLFFLILALIIPILIQLGTFFGFLPEFAPEGDRVLFIGCNIVILLILIITSWRLITLYQRSRKNNSTNTFSSIFYILIWIILWFRSFSFFNSFLNITQASTDPNILSSFIDILLLVFTSIMVLRGLGEKVYDSFIFNANNMPFFLYAFTLLYIEGQIIMITGAGTLTGIFANRNQINLYNNFLIIIITVIFYWWYSEYSLERKGFIIRKHYNPEDVAFVIQDFKEFLVNNNALDTNKIGEDKIQDFLRSRNLEIKKIKPSEEKSELIPNENLNNDE
ncbi:MAG: hypothetical protein KAW03_00450 [Candidatus Lokiarchaeota archaeon]|nr:hypothetical protein [Candidatus Lokiarchaeota archaeon]